MSDTQKDVFLGGEADQWFSRNVDHLSEGQNDLVVDAVNRLSIAPKRILEIGAANGHRIHAMAETFNAKGYGIDPSQAAIDDAVKRYPDLNMQVGTADTLPYEDGHFDLVIFGFCLYLVDPKDHFRTVAEADRVLADGGALVIFDFLSPLPYSNNYAHLENVRAHKMEFQRYFTAHPAYTLVQRTIKAPSGIPEIDNREAADILVKNMQGSFPSNPYKR